MGDYINPVPTNARQEQARQRSQESLRGDLKNTRKPPVFGAIVDQRVAETRRGYKILQVRIHIDRRDSNIRQGAENTWYSLGHPADEIASVYGSSIIGRRCRLEYSTPDPFTGIVYIDHDQFFQSDLDSALALPSVGGGILAPPGSMF